MAKTFIEFYLVKNEALAEVKMARDAGRFVVLTGPTKVQFQANGPAELFDAAPLPGNVYTVISTDPKSMTAVLEQH